MIREAIILVILALLQTANAAEDGGGGNGSWNKNLTGTLSLVDTPSTTITKRCMAKPWR